MPQASPQARFSYGDVIVLRYITPDGRIEMCWPCRVVQDDSDLLALYISAGSRYKAGPKRTAAEKRHMPRNLIPPDEYVWRNDTLRLMLPGRQHSVWLFWDGLGDQRAFSYYFVNMEEPFRRTAAGVDTQDHTLDIVISPDLEWTWRDEEELQNHVQHGFYTSALARAARQEGERVIAEFADGTHPCLAYWTQWNPATTWGVPDIPDGWDATPVTLWSERHWVYGKRSEV
jgi:predicted RNA-binding protein associated with RNAse of E/G family